MAMDDFTEGKEQEQKRKKIRLLILAIRCNFFEIVESAYIYQTEFWWIKI